MTDSAIPSRQPRPRLRRRGALRRYLAATLVGLAAGVASAASVTGGTMGDGSLVVGRWSTDLAIGGPAASPWVRARVARVGLLALSREETVYFDRTTDEEGEPLRDACRYRLAGGALPARWWSVTIYGADQMLPRNPDDAASVDATRLATDAAGTWTATVSTARPAAGAWISSRGAGTFSLTLRLYNALRVDAAALRALALPTVRRTGCAL